MKHHAKVNMRIRKKKWAQPELDLCRYFVKEPLNYCGKWKEFFNNDNDIELEVGCGNAASLHRKLF